MQSKTSSLLNIVKSVFNSYSIKTFLNHLCFIVDMTITKTQTIGDVVGKYPFLVSTIESFGLHCVGCEANAFETFEQGMVGHGFPVEKIDKLVDAMNQAVTKQDTVKAELTITEKSC